MREQARNKYRELSEEENEIKKDIHEIGTKICQNKRTKDWRSNKKFIAIQKNQWKSLNLVTNILIK